ncbi:MAG: hypothetical protein IH969_05015, partial [Candidatus Krumholzibacteriota bacterium]|nr:hypothetical protein [Candidatus Krumholzibacteriota bacterium]
DGELTRYSLYGVDGEVSGKGFRLGGELARSEDTFSSDGNAYKVRAGYEGGGNGISLYHRRIDGGFNNPSFRGSNSELATLKSGFEGALGVGRKFSVNADGYAHELFRSNEHKSSARGIVAYRHKSLELQAGGRTARHDQASGNEHGVLSILGLKLGAEKRFGLASQWEKNLGDEYVEDFPDRLRTQAAAPIGGDFRVLLSHEYSTAPGRPGTNQFTAGVEGQPAPGTSAYSKYSMNHLAGDTRMGAVSGVLQSFAINDRVTGTVGIEGFLSMSNRDDDEYFSFKSGTNWRVPASHFVEAQYELRWQRSRTRNMIRLNAAQQFRAGTGLLIKNVLSFSDASEGDNELSYHNTLAGAYRPLAGPVQTLVMMRNYYERFTPVDPDAIRWRLVLSGDVNWRPRFDHEVRFKYAYKHMEDFSFGLSTTTDTDLVLGQYIYRFAPRWDVDAWGRWLNQRGGGTAGTGVGIEVGHLFFRTLRVAAGYSINGFEDPDITSTDAWSKGFNLRVQLILSEWILADFEKLNDE